MIFQRFQRLFLIGFLVLQTCASYAQGLFFSDTENRIFKHSDHRVFQTLTGDFNGDGQNDIISMNHEEILVLAQDTTDNFDLVHRTPAIHPDSVYSTICVADMDVDGDLDIVVSVWGIGGPDGQTFGQTLYNPKIGLYVGRVWLRAGPSFLLSEERWSDNQLKWGNYNMNISLSVVGDRER